jgi:hypothetical protein
MRHIMLHGTDTYNSYHGIVDLAHISISHMLLMGDAKTVVTPQECYPHLLKVSLQTRVYSWTMDSCGSHPWSWDHHPLILIIIQLSHRYVTGTGVRYCKIELVSLSHTYSCGNGYTLFTVLLHSR